MKITKILSLLIAAVMLVSCLVACDISNIDPTLPSFESPTKPSAIIPSTPSSGNNGSNANTNVDANNLTHELFDGENAFVILNDNKPYFTADEITTNAFESYSDLDSLGRCGVAFACVSKELMPTSERESISSVYPSGWKYNGKSNNNQYDHVDGKYIYNRCHMIGFQLTGENANEKNLITGTRYLNIDGMLAFENMIADAVRENNLHVMYRVTPVYVGNNLLPEGLILEAYSVEDNGETIEFCVFSLNVQPGVNINYATGQNSEGELPEVTPTPSTPSIPTGETTFVVNTNSKKFHLPTCSYAEKISESNRAEITTSYEQMIADEYEPCGVCLKK